MLWRRRAKEPEPVTPEPPAPDPYERDRRRLLERDPFGVVIETTYDACTTHRRHSMMTAAAAGGAAAVYFSSGDVLQGSASDVALTAVTQRLLEIAEQSLALIPSAAAPDDPPELGRVLIAVSGADGHHAIVVLEDDLGTGTHELSPLFYAAHEVFTQLRLAQDSQDGERPLEPYETPRWRQHRVVLPEGTPLTADEVFAELERRAAHHAVVYFSGGNDEGGADEATIVGGDGTSTDLSAWAHDIDPADQALADTLEAPLLDVRFVGSLSISGTLRWDVARRTITVLESIHGADEEKAD
jgi:hypothetical protein